MKTAALAASLMAMAACSAWDKTAICCDGGYEYRHRSQWEAEKEAADKAARLAALERDRQRLADELALSQKQGGNLAGRVTELEQQLADRDRELASLRSHAGETAALASQLSAAQSDLSRSQGQSADLARQLDAAKQRSAHLETQLAAMGSTVGDKDKLAAELAVANQRIAQLEAQVAAAGAAGADKDRAAADLAVAQQRVAALERQLADRDKELAGLRGDLSSEMAKLKEAQRGLLKALRPEIDKGAITVDLNNERLLINLASGYLFASGEDQLKPAGVDALKQVGVILKDFPEYRVAVDGHTDNRPIRSSLKNRFPTNKELSQARAANAAKALTEGGLSAAETHGYADTIPVMPNTTDAGRAKNRRVEVRVTK
jgi:chemotaxis protein MotB